MSEDTFDQYYNLTVASAVGAQIITLIEFYLFVAKN